MVGSCGASGPDVAPVTFVEPLLRFAAEVIEISSVGGLVPHLNLVLRDSIDVDVLFVLVLVDLHRLHVFGEEFGVLVELGKQRYLFVFIDCFHQDLRVLEIIHGHWWFADNHLRQVRQLLASLLLVALKQSNSQVVVPDLLGLLSDLLIVFEF